MNFKSDNIASVHPHVLNAMQEANTGLQNSYGQEKDICRLATFVMTSNEETAMLRNVCS